VKLLPPDIGDLEQLRRRVVGVAKRLCEVETWRRIAHDLIEHGGDDIIKLEERVDALQATNKAQAERIARLELQCGIVIERKDVDA
jgi:hypothetical protein